MLLLLQVIACHSEVTLRCHVDHLQVHASDVEYTVVGVVATSRSPPLKLRPTGVGLRLLRDTGSVTDSMSQARVKWAVLLHRQPPTYAVYSATYSGSVRRHRLVPFSRVMNAREMINNILHGSQISGNRTTCASAELE